MVATMPLPFDFLGQAKVRFERRRHRVADFYARRLRSLIVGVGIRSRGRLHADQYLCHGSFLSQLVYFRSLEADWLKIFGFSSAGGTNSRLRLWFYSFQEFAFFSQAMSWVGQEDSFLGR